MCWRRDGAGKWLEHHGANHHGGLNSLLSSQMNAPNWRKWAMGGCAFVGGVSYFYLFLFCYLSARRWDVCSTTHSPSSVQCCLRHPKMPLSKSRSATLATVSQNKCSLLYICTSGILSQQENTLLTQDSDVFLGQDSAYSKTPSLWGDFALSMASVFTPVYKWTDHWEKRVFCKAHNIS